MHSMETEERIHRNCFFYMCYLLMGPLLLANGIYIMIATDGQNFFGLILLCISVPSTILGGISIIVYRCRSVPQQVVIIQEPSTQEQLQYVYVSRPPGTECSICEENPRVIAYIPCGHTVCMSCNQKLIDKPCSFCRAPIHDRLQLY